MEQLAIFQTEKKEDGVCVFTGHRILEEDFDVEKTREEIKKLIENGTRSFLNGMAIGFDLTTAELLLDLKKEYPFIKLIACIPCRGQEKYYSKENKTRYQSVLSRADEIVFLSDGYYQGCMQVRDKYMAERADRMLAYCKKKEGGTAYTVRCFKKLRPDGKIIFL